MSIEFKSEIIILATKAIEQHPEELVFSLNWQDKKVWVKRRPDSKIRRWTHCQAMIARSLRIPMLYPTVTAGGAKSLHFEAQRLKNFKAKNIAVPEVIAVTDTFLITEDVGIPLDFYLKNKASPREQENLLFLAAKTLNHLHQNQLCHSRAYLKDMILQEDKIFFIDLEEDVLSKLSLEQAQAKDIWLFLNNASAFADLSILKELFVQCTKNTSSKVLDTLYQLMRMLKPLRMICKPLGPAILGRDAWRVVKVNLMLEKYFKNYALSRQILIK